MTHTLGDFIPYSAMGAVGGFIIGSFATNSKKGLAIATGLGVLAGIAFVFYYDATHERNPALITQTDAAPIQPNVSVVETTPKK